jgi:hypothetical protein
MGVERRPVFRRAMAPDERGVPHEAGGQATTRQPLIPDPSPIARRETAFLRTPNGEKGACLPKRAKDPQLPDDP